LAGWKVRGILSTPVLQNGQKIAINVEDLHSRTQRRLATWQGCPAPGSSELGWAFDPQVLMWGDAILQSATPCDLLVVDELGPLELERGEGWSAGISAVESGDFKLGVVVIRPELLGKVHNRWPIARMINIKSVSQAQFAAVDLARQVVGQTRT
jgi:hypothetical protein